MRYAFALIITLNTQLVCAAGFGTPVQGANGLGSAYAGIAASAYDASTIFANPAGMTYLNGSQFVIANHLIRPASKFNDEGSLKANGISPTGGEGGDIGSLVLLPTLFYAHQLSDALSVGVGITSPFGLKTHYEDDWIGRFQSVKSQLKTININPAIAYQVNERLSIGAGISAMRAEAELTRAVNRVVQPESFVSIKGDDWGVGYNFGLIFKATESSRIGMAYRSRVQLELKGDAKFDAPLSAANSGVKTSLTTPESFSLSSFTALNERWDLLADVTWTRWSRFKEINIIREDGTTLTSLPQHWSNNLRYSVGANYKWNDALQLRAGLAYDQEAMSDEYRQARIPSNDRTWLSLGATWFKSANSKLDIGYTHIFVKDASINQNQNTPAQGFNGYLIGTYEAQVNILAIQYSRYLD